MTDELEVTVSNIEEQIEFVETDAEIIQAELISRFEEYVGETLYPGDERRIFLQGFAYVLADQLVHINETGRGNLLRYAEGNELDALGELYNNARLEATTARTTIEFTLSKAQSTNITIPAGTRVTPDGVLFFATDEPIIFYANETTLTKSVSATATTSGSSHNDLAIGQINKLVDSNQYVASVTNTTISSGGSDIETDDEYRERLRLSPFAMSVAGPSKAYESIALSVTGEVGDVSVYSPSAGVVEIAVVKEGGEIPSSDDTILEDILEACSDKDRRLLTDNVRVVPATPIDIDVDVTYYVSNNDVSKLEAIQASVLEYQSWQVEKIGRDINPDKLNSLMFSSGAARVVITAPTYQALGENEIARFNNVNVKYGGSITM